MDISVILIDNYNDYKWHLGNTLIRNDILVMGRYSYAEFIQSSLIALPDLALLAFDDHIDQTRDVINFITANYPSVKILVNSTVYDKQVVDSMIKMPIDGLIFDALQNQEELITAINKVYSDGKYFNL